EGVGTHRLTGTGGTGNEHVGQLGDVAHHTVAPDVLAHGKGYLGGAVGKGPVADDVPNGHRAHLAVGHLNAHGGNLIGDGGHTHRGGAQSQGDVVGEVGDLVQLHALLQLQLV